MLQGTTGVVEPLWEPSTPLDGMSSTLSTTLAANTSLDLHRSPDFQMKKAAFFFKLQRELDKARPETHEHAKSLTYTLDQRFLPAKRSGAQVENGHIALKATSCYQSNSTRL